MEIKRFGQGVRLIFFITAMVLSVFFTLSVESAAEGRYWIGGTDNWSVDEGWNTQPDGSGLSGVPADGDNAYLWGAGFGETVNYINTGNPFLKVVEINSPSTGITTLQQSQDTLTITSGFLIGAYGRYDLSGSGQLVMPVSGANWFSIDGAFNQSGGTANVDITAIYPSGTFTQTGGSFYSRDFLHGGTYDLSGGTSEGSVMSINGSGIVNNSGGMHSFSGALYVGDTVSGGTYNLSNTGILTTTNVSEDGSTVVGEWVTGGVFNQDGGTHTTNRLTLGRQSTGSGTYNLYNGTLNTDWTEIGPEGAGTFNQYDGMHTVKNDLNLGQTSTGNGSYNLSDGLLDVQRLEHIGINGTGSFTQDGGVHQIAGYLMLGGPGGNGSYNLTNGSLSVGTVEWVGSEGTGTFNQSGGTHTVNESLILGDLAGSQGTYNLSNLGNLEVTFTTYVGNMGTGTFSQTGGTHTTGSLWIAEAVDSNGSYELQSGNLNVFGNAEIGRSGTGSLTQSGGDVTIGNDLWLGVNSTGVGTYNQSGGTNTITNGLRLGVNADSQGTYNLSNGNLNTGQTLVGFEGTGTFTQSGGTHTIADNLEIGHGANSNGIYTLGSGVVSAHDLHIGENGTGVFTQNGGTVNVTSELFMGRNTTAANGTYNLNDGNLTVDWVEHVGVNGTAVFNQNGGTNKAANLEIGASGTYNMFGGLLDVNAFLINNGGTFNFTGGNVKASLMQNYGTLVGTGTITGNLTNSGTVSPGMSPGTLTINGDYNQTGTGNLIIELASLDLFDSLNVSGNVSLGGKLDIDLFGNFIPSIGDSFKILDAFGQLTGTFSSIDWPLLAAGNLWDIFYDYTNDDVFVRVIEGQQQVPEPSTFLLFGIGFAGIGLLRKRFKK